MINDLATAKALSRSGSWASSGVTLQILHGVVGVDDHDGTSQDVGALRKSP